jgi:hypothetical protein
MMRVAMNALLILLWVVWAWFFFGVAQLAMAWTGSFIPDSPIDKSGHDLIGWLWAVALLYGTPVLLTFLTWRPLRRRRSPKNSGDTK